MATMADLAPRLAGAAACLPAVPPRPRAADAAWVPRGAPPRLPLSRHTPVCPPPGRLPQAVPANGSQQRRRRPCAAIRTVQPAGAATSMHCPPWQAGDTGEVAADVPARRAGAPRRGAQHPSRSRPVHHTGVCVCDPGQPRRHFLAAAPKPAPLLTAGRWPWGWPPACTGGCCVPDPLCCTPLRAASTCPVTPARTACTAVPVLPCPALHCQIALEWAAAVAAVCPLQMACGSAHQQHISTFGAPLSRRSHAGWGATCSRWRRSS